MSTQEQDVVGGMGGCAKHPETSAIRRCARCGDNVCATCLGAREDVCVACVERLESRGKIPHVEWLAIVMIVHGAMMALYGAVLTLYMGVIGVSMMGHELPPAPAPNAPPPELFVGLLGGTALMMAVAVGLPGLLQIAAGLYLRTFRYRWFGILALASGALAFIGCYCIPSAVALMIWGFIVLADESVAKRFELGKS